MTPETAIRVAREHLAFRRRRFREVGEYPQSDSEVAEALEIVIATAELWLADTSVLALVAECGRRPR